MENHGFEILNHLGDNLVFDTADHTEDYKRDVENVGLFRVFHRLLESN